MTITMTIDRENNYIRNEISRQSRQILVKYKKSKGCNSTEQKVKPLVHSAAKLAQQLLPSSADSFLPLL